MQVSSQMVIAGAGGHARVLIEAVQSMGRWIVAALTDPEVTGEVLGVPVVGTDEVLAELRERGMTAALVGVGSTHRPTRRVELYERLQAIGFVLPTVCHSSAQVSATAMLGDGTAVLAGAIINTQAVIGRNVIVNTGAIVEHGCQVGDHVHIAPRAVLGGGAVVAPEVHVGIGAVVLEGRQIGRGSVIGAGAVVLDDVPPNTLCVGVPAEAIRQLAENEAPAEPKG